MGCVWDVSVTKQLSSSELLLLNTVLQIGPQTRHATNVQGSWCAEVIVTSSLNVS
jgi:hypothetical protein